jgi:predicted ATPase
VKITSLHIQNFKSIRDFKIENPAPFTVFVGANGVGKSNLFEALEFRYYLLNYSMQAPKLFGNVSELLPYEVQNDNPKISFKIDSDQFSSDIAAGFVKRGQDLLLGIAEMYGYWDNYFFFQEVLLPTEMDQTDQTPSKEVEQLYTNFSRIFIGNQKLVKVNVVDASKLNIDGSNLEKVLKRILKNEAVREEFLEWLGLFIPEFKDIQVHSDNISGTDTLLLYEKNSSRPFTKNLISDGTYNILCLLTAVYQSESPQFLCLEEPENGLNPYVVKELVGFFRHQCEEKGHYIWLNTHSQTLVNHVSPEELIVLNKVNGQTVPRQFSSQELQGIPMDEAWLTNVLGGGIPW